MDLMKHFIDPAPESNATLSARDAIAQSGKIAEVVLSDGRFCEIYPTRLWHYSVAQDPDPNKQFAKFACLAVLIDDKVVSAQDIYTMPMRDAMLIQKHMQFV